MGAADAIVRACTITVGVFMDTSAGILDVAADILDVAGVCTGNAAVGIRGCTTNAGVFVDVCGLCALGRARQYLVVQIFANWSGNVCMLALSLRWAKLRWISGGIAHACVRLCLVVV